MTKCFFEDDLHLEPCCQYAFYRMKQFLPGDKVTLFMITSNWVRRPKNQVGISGDDSVQEEDAEEVDNFGQGGFNRARKFIWELFEEPNKSKLGKVVFFLDNVAMACQPSLLARTQLMPLELYSHNLHLINRARAHHAQCRALVQDSGCTAASKSKSSCRQPSYKLSEHRHLDLLKL